MILFTIFLISIIVPNLGEVESILIPSGEAAKNGYCACVIHPNSATFV
jgi:hypothetical protein